MKKIFALIVMFFATIIALLFFEGLFRIINVNKEIQFLQVDQSGRKVGINEYDVDLGWKNQPNFEKTKTWPYRQTLEKINSEGWRDKDYKFIKEDDVFRVAIIGCSRTYGYGVNVDETYTKVLERMLNEKYPQKFEVMNFGVNGYGLSQMALNYQKNVKNYSPDIVILQFYLPTVYRASWTKIWGTQKPTYILKNDQLSLSNSPVPKERFKSVERWFLERSFLYKFVKEKLSEIKEIQRFEFKEHVQSNKNLNKTCSMILQQLNQQTAQNNSRLIVFTWGKHSKWLETILLEAKVEYFVLEKFSDLDYWKKKGNIENPLPTGHWSPIGNQFVAESIMNYLEANVIK
ncbi:MAG: hypothetical protein KJ736_09720 [Candidatus Omnitrophica bacterium]|nr:hypothetical protein [Candidatus Omnitrophota bacterium]